MNKNQSVTACSQQSSSEIDGQPNDGKNYTCSSSKTKGSDGSLYRFYASLGRKLPLHLAYNVTMLHLCAHGRLKNSLKSRHGTCFDCESLIGGMKTCDRIRCHGKPVHIYTIHAKKEFSRFYSPVSESQGLAQISSVQ